MDEGPLVTLAERLAGLGIDVLRFEFPYMQARRRGETTTPLDEDEALADCFVEACKGFSHPGRRIIGGWSLGGRIAALAAPRLEIDGLLCLSYPFHPIRDPSQGGAIESLRRLQIPTLIVQGSRDAFGNREQVRGYSLGEAIQVCWLEDANHAFRPRKSSGHTYAGHLQQAIQASETFIRNR